MLGGFKGSSLTTAVSGGKRLAVRSLAGSLDAIKGEKDDDWAVVKVTDMNSEWPVIALDPVPAPKVNDLTYILQHPNAQQKRLGFVRNRITDVDERVVRHLESAHRNERDRRGL